MWPTVQVGLTYCINIWIVSVVADTEDEESRSTFNLERKKANMNERAEYCQVRELSNFKLSVMSSESGFVMDLLSDAA